jgi:hypothetical protein
MHDEHRLLACPVNGHPRYAHAATEMLTVAAEVGVGGSPNAVTDGDGGADMRRASNRPIVLSEAAID